MAATAHRVPTAGVEGASFQAAEPPARLPRARWVAALVIAIALLGAVVASELNRSPVSSLRVSSGSMEPTLAIGQLVQLDASAYASAAPQVGDIVAFRAPAGATGDTPVCGEPVTAGRLCPRSTAAESDQIFIKRIVAAPGDRISVESGIVVRNGTPQSEPFARLCDACILPGEITVPADEWFLMGDNRPSSDDSRYWGPVPTAWIVGRVSR